MADAAPQLRPLMHPTQNCTHADLGTWWCLADERIIGVTDPEDDTLVIWGIIKMGEPPKQLVPGGEFFVLKKVNRVPKVGDVLGIPLMPDEGHGSLLPDEGHGEPSDKGEDEKPSSTAAGHGEEKK